MTEPTETLTPEQAAAALEAGYDQHMANDPLAQHAAELIRSGKVDETTTFEDAKAILADFYAPYTPPPTAKQ